MRGKKPVIGLTGLTWTKRRTVLWAYREIICNRFRKRPHPRVHKRRRLFK